MISQTLSLCYYFSKSMNTSLPYSLVATSMIAATAFLSVPVRAETWITHTSKEANYETEPRALQRRRIDFQIDIDSVRKAGDIVILKERERTIYHDSPGRRGYYKRVVLIDCANGKITEQDDPVFSYQRLGGNRWMAAWNNKFVFDDMGLVNPEPRDPRQIPRVSALLESMGKRLWSHRAKLLAGRWSIACPQPKPANLI